MNLLSTGPRPSGSRHDVAMVPSSTVDPSKVCFVKNKEVMHHRAECFNPDVQYMSARQGLHDIIAARVPIVSRGLWESQKRRLGCHEIAIWYWCVCLSKYEYLRGIARRKGGAGAGWKQLVVMTNHCTRTWVLNVYIICTCVCVCLCLSMSVKIERDIQRWRARRRNRERSFPLLWIRPSNDVERRVQTRKLLSSESTSILSTDMVSYATSSSFSHLLPLCI